MRWQFPTLVVQCQECKKWTPDSIAKEKSCIPRQLILRQRIALFTPVADAAVHRNNIAVAHLLQIVGGEGGAETAAAVENDFGIEVGDFLFNVTLDDAFAEVNRSGKMILGVFAFFADVDKKKFVASVDPLFDLRYVGLAYVTFGVIDDFQKTGRVLLVHGSSFCWILY